MPSVLGMSLLKSTPSYQVETTMSGRRARSARTEPTTFEECMDAGVDQEERGERFSVGTKAKRFVRLPMA